jgi:sec-independent protein translocase protein TatC
MIRRMSVAPKPSLPKPTRVADPDHYRMSLGDHLEELRLRLVRALLGYFVAFVGCLVFVKDFVFPFFCEPLLRVLQEYDMNPQLYSTSAGDTFALYLQVSAIAAAVIAGPWVIWQMWLFIAAGLYPSERKAVTKYVPLSIALMLIGVAFAFWIVLPWTLQFFLHFTADIRLPNSFSPVAAAVTPDSVFQVPTLEGDPPEPVEGQMWFNSVQQRLKFALGGQVRVVQFGPENLVAPIVTIPTYVNLVMALIGLFAIAFQLPLVVMAVVALGIVDVAELKEMRRVVYFVMVIVAAVITPGDVVVATLALIIPLIGLYEFGLLMAGRSSRRRALA